MLALRQEARAPIVVPVDDGFVVDSPLEGSGFELSVPRGDRLRVLGSPTVTSVPRPLALGGDAGHDAGPDDTSKRGGKHRTSRDSCRKGRIVARRARHRRPKTNPV